MRLYLFPMAAVTNCQKFSGLNEPKFIILQCWGLEVHNGSHWVEVGRVDILRYSESARLSSFLEAPGENLFSSPTPKGCLCFWFMAFFYLQS